jgi:hypothetical protein
MKMDTALRAQVESSAISNLILDVAGAHFSWALDFREPNLDRALQFGLELGLDGVNSNWALGVQINWAQAQFL